MSINWVMLSETPHSFVKLPGERVLYTSPARTSLSLTSTSSIASQRISIKSSDGVVHLTNQRIVYTPAKSTPELESFSCPIQNLHDSHVTAPFFGPNTWAAVVEPVRGGGLPPVNSAIELKLVFKDGGAFDYHTTFESMKERILQAIENSSRSRQEALRDVDLEDLPAYESHSGGTTSSEMPPPHPESTTPPREPSPLPNEPPPGYEEVQRESVVEELERQHLSEAR